MNRKQILGLLVAGLALASLFACGTGNGNDSQVRPSAAPKAATANTTRTAPANATPALTAGTPRDDAVHVTAYGRLSFVEDKKLTFRTGGNIGQIKVKELDRVTKGQELARLDTTSLEQALKTAEFGVKTAELAIKTAEADRRAAEYAVTTSQADLLKAQNDFQSATIDLQSANNTLNQLSFPYTYATFSINVPNALGNIQDALQKLGEASKGLNAAPGSDEYLNALNKIKTAQDNLITAQQNLLNGVSIESFGSTITKSGNPYTTYGLASIWSIQAAQLSVAKAQFSLSTYQGLAGKASVAVDSARNALTKYQVAVDKANNDLDIARNSVAIARTNLENAIIIAPIDGIVTNVNIKVGDYLSSSAYSSTTAIEVIAPQKMELDVSVNELDVPGVKPGQKVVVSVDALPGQQFQSVVDSVNLLPTTSSNMMTYTVEIIFDVPSDTPLKSGMQAMADIITGTGP